MAAGLLAAILGTPAFATGNDASAAPPISCGNGIPGGVNCIASKKELKEARNAFREGVKLQDHRQLEQAFTKFDTASRYAPQDLQFLTAREVVKARLVFEHVQRGNILMLEDARARAAAEFSAALDLDPDNQFARERLAEASRQAAPALPRALPVRVADSGEIHLEPKEGRATFHYNGEVRGLFAELAAAYGVNAQFDDSVQARQVRFNVDDVDFFTALKLACQVSKTMWAALDSHQMLIAADNAENHKQFDRMSLRTFILPPHSTPQESTDLVNTMRNMFDLKFVSSGQTSDTVEVRGPQPMLDACSKLMEQLSNERPQVMLDIQRVSDQPPAHAQYWSAHSQHFQLVQHSSGRAGGPWWGRVFRHLINQLIASGGINQAGSTALSGLLAQLGRTGQFHFQPAAGYVRRRAHIYGTESRPIVRGAFA